MTRHHSRAQEQRYQEIFARFARRIRRTKGLRKTIKLMGESFLDLLGADFDTLQAIIDLSELVAIHQPKLERAEALFRIRDAGVGSRRGDFQDVEDAFVQLSALFLLNAQLRKHYSKDSELVFLFLLAVEMLPRTNSIIPNHIYVELYRRTLDLAANLREPIQRACIASLRAHYANVLTQDQRPEIMSLALDHFQEAAEELAYLYEEEVEGSSFSYGQCLNNFAQALKKKTFGDRIFDLKKAIELFDRCLAIRERHEYLGAAAMSAQLRCAAANELFQRLGNQPENMGLLKEALEIGEEELEKLDKSSEVERRAAAYDFHFIRESLWLSISLARSLLLEAELALKEDDQIKASLIAHCRQVLTRHEEVLTILGPAYRGVFFQFATHLDEEPVLFSGPEALEALRAIGEATLRHGGVLAAADGARIYTILKNTEFRSFPEEFWPLLSTMFSRLSPLSVGAGQTRVLFEIEGALLQKYSKSCREAGEVDEYFQQVLPQALEDLHDWRLAQSHRRLLASRISTLAQVLLESGDVDEPGTLLNVLDYLGGQVYGADLLFFGAGEIAEEQKDEEAYWRLQFYRARQEFDVLSRAISLRESAEFDPEWRHVLLEAAERTRIIGSFDDDEITFRDVENLYAESEVVYREICVLYNYGRQHKWAPAYISASTKSGSPSSWLLKNPDIALLVSAPGRVELFFVKSNQIMRRSLLDGFDEFELTELEEAAGVFLKAQGRFQYEIADDERHEIFDQALSNQQKILSTMGEEIATILQSESLNKLVILARHHLDLIPWEAMPTGSDVHAPLLGEVFSIVRLPTLKSAGSIARDQDKRSAFSQETTYIGVEPTSDDPLSFVYAACLDKEHQSGLTREEFDELAMRSSTLRLFTHAFHDPLSELSGFLVHKEVVGSESSFEAEEGEHKYQNSWFGIGEVQTLYLANCRRVELWACESLRTEDFLGRLLNEDEPRGLGAAFLRAGAHRVLGSLWRQPIGSALLISERFQQEFEEENQSDAFADASALARAVAAYRQTLSSKGAFTQGVARYVEANIKDVEDIESLRVPAIRAGWISAFQALTGRKPGNAAMDKFENIYLSGFRRHTLEKELSKTGDLDAPSVIEKWLAIWRGPAAWAGWRVTARDRNHLY